MFNISVILEEAKGGITRSGKTDKKTAAEIAEAAEKRGRRPRIIKQDKRINK